MVSFGFTRAFTGIYVVLCLLGTFKQAASLKCYFCAGTGSKQCQDAGYFLEGFKDTNGKPLMLKNCTAPYNHSCIIEEYRAGGNAASHIRECSDGRTFAYPSNEALYRKLLAEAENPRNRSACIFNSIVQVCLTVCNTDFCNGPIPSVNAADTYTMHISWVLIIFIGNFLTR
ncbi:hypothetical protein ACJMK2_007617 [Sinanodonta woodiana]|uniref:Protein sleepless n=1 Tax=Sinanodonta woodiana TaxID=1069815 RepID=A0ABD3VJ22_SINWO